MNALIADIHNICIISNAFIIPNIVLLNNKSRNNIKKNISNNISNIKS